MCFVDARDDWTIFVQGPREPHTDGERRNVTLHHQVAPRNHAVWAYRYTRLYWLQQDIATPHTVSAAIQLIQKHFGMHVSSRNTEHRWQPTFLTSVHQTSCYGVTWRGYRTRGAYKIITQLRRSVGAAARAGSVDTCRKTIKILWRRVDLSFAKKEGMSNMSCSGWEMGMA